MLALFERVQSTSDVQYHLNYNINNVTITTTTTSTDDCARINEGESKVCTCSNLKHQQQDKSVDSISTTIPFQSQRYSWDCGLACCCMVLRYLGQDASTVYSSDLARLQCGQSVWTIHLAYLLKYHCVRTDFFTVTLGADKNYAEQKFYQNHFDTDETKINRLFECAHRNGVSVTKRSMELAVILQHLSLGNILICLVDSHVLTQNIFFEKCGRLTCFRDGRNSYQGHFVVVCGYNKTKQQIFYRNPALSHDEVSCCNWRTFEVARKRYGTDEDLLFIYTS